jgi:hypothetical protein
LVLYRQRAEPYVETRRISLLKYHYVIEQMMADLNDTDVDNLDLRKILQLKLQHGLWGLNLLNANLPHAIAATLR